MSFCCYSFITLETFWLTNQYIRYQIVGEVMKSILSTKDTIHHVNLGMRMKKMQFLSISTVPGIETLIRN